MTYRSGFPIAYRVSHISLPYAKYDGINKCIPFTQARTILKHYDQRLDYKIAYSMHEQHFHSNGSGSSILLQLP
jgi:hypothetical protein